MANSVNEPLSAAMLTHIKGLVRSELKRRNQRGDISSFGGPAYEYSTSPSINNPAKIEHYNKLITPMRAIRPDLYPSGEKKENDPITVDIMNLKANAEALSQIPMDYTSNTCSSLCSGLCYTTCTTSCRDTCETACNISCALDCTSGCKNGCKNGCKGGCSDNCATWCFDNCAGGELRQNEECQWLDGCTKACLGSCELGTCTWDCVGTCSRECHTYCSDCSDGCRWECRGSCVDGCDGTCHGQIVEGTYWP